MTYESGISVHSGKDSKPHHRYFTRVFFSVIYVCLSIDNRICSASPSAVRGWGKEDSRHALILRRSLQNQVVPEPHEKCFETTCNRVTHYCDEVIRSCASCEDDCHLGRIDGDELATQECKKKCDWYYYINSLKSNLCSTSETTELSAGLTDHVGAGLSDYQLFAIVLAIVTICFTALIVIIIGVFCCFFKKLSPKAAVFRQETAEGSLSIYKPQNLRSYSTTDIKRKQNSKDTDIKLLAESSEDSLNNRTVQQESIPSSLYIPSSMNLASTSQIHNCYNKAYVAKDRSQNT